MGYSIDLPNAARRHLRAAYALYDAMTGVTHPHRAVAGYLYGIAAECAVKEIMRQSNIPRFENKYRNDDPYYAHFPELKTLLRDRIFGRQAEQLRNFAEDDSLMNGWNTQMRYAPNKEITQKQVDRWRKQSEMTVQAMEAI